MEKQGVKEGKGGESSVLPFKKRVENVLSRKKLAYPTQTSELRQGNTQELTEKKTREWDEKSSESGKRNETSSFSSSAFLPASQSRLFPALSSVRLVDSLRRV